VNKRIKRYLRTVNSSSSKLELNRIKHFLSIINEPQKDIKTILIAGTNGKGSVATFLSYILHSLGYKTGLFTSPHLVEVNERIRINHKKISDDELEDLVVYVQNIAKQETEKGNLPHPLTFFETLAASAFLYFKRKKIDWGVFEIGLGGRLDATNTASPDASVITTIGYDHLNTLGTTLTKIAKEKAGIIRKRKPVIVGRLPFHVYNVIKEITKEKKAPLIKAFDVNNILRERKNGLFSYKTDRNIYIFKPKIIGSHQGINAAVAIKTYENLQVYNSKKKRIVINGIQKAFIEGRLETINDRIILDSAHNSDGIKTLREHLRKNNLKNLICVFGMTAGEKKQDMIKYLLPYCDEFVITKPEIKKAVEPEEIKDVLLEKLKKSIKKINIAKTPAKAINNAIKRARDRKVLVTGSLYLVGNIKREFKENGYKYN